MNNSGEAVGPLMRWYKVTPEDIIVAHDDMDIPAGTIRIRKKGSSGGHNGIKSLIAHLGSENFPRVRLGVGRPLPGWSVVNHVLAPFPQEDKTAVDEAIKYLIPAVECIVNDSVDMAMNKYNPKKAKKNKVKQEDKIMADIRALYADEDGNILDAPKGFKALARTGTDIIELSPDDLIPLPESADLMFLPDRLPLAKYGDEIMPIMGNAVAAILPAGYTRLYMPAFKKEDDAQMLPLYGYTAVVVYKDELYVAAMYTDENDKWDPAHYNTRNLHKLVKRVQKDLPDNRLVEHLGNCSLTWHCCTAQNLFYRRWEAGIPSSPVCNANCFGCISLQPAECCPSPQSRIKFRPTPKEIAQIGIYHLETAPDAIISFGQGCEGEPSLAVDNIVPAIEKIPQKNKTKVKSI